MSEVDLDKVSKRVAHEWNRGHIASILKVLRQLPKTVVLEVLVCTADAVEPHRREQLMTFLGFDVQQGHGDVLHLLGL